MVLNDGRWLAVTVASGVALASACGVDKGEQQDGASVVGSVDARAVVETLQSRFRLSHASVPQVAQRPARVTLPALASAPFAIEDEASGVSLHVALDDALDARAEKVDGYVVYRRAHASGAHLVHRVSAIGTEDFVLFEHAPHAPSVDYGISLDDGVAGLRLVGNTLEFLDGEGAPRLRVAPPYIMDRDGKRHDATLTVEGCAVDTDPTAPYGRAVIEPGAEQCTLRVGWNGNEVTYPALLDPAWLTTGSMSNARTTHTASVLGDGRVLVVGGLFGTTANPLASAELYDPSSGTWSATTPMMVPRYSHTASVLGDGRVLVAGGNEYTYLTSCLLYDPATGTWSTTSPLAAPRASHTDVVLNDGRVLVVAGFGPPTGHLATAEIYDPSSGTWNATPDMTTGRTTNTTTLLADGRVLVAGGYNLGALSSVELYDPVSGTWSLSGAMNLGRTGHTATLLADGRLLVAGGYGETSPVVSVELYDPALGTWSPTYPMNSARSAHTASMLADGSLLVAGGTSSTAPYTAELRDPASGLWSPTAPLITPRLVHTASMLADGRVLLAGGYDANSATLASAELYDEAPLGMLCSSATECTSGYCVDGVCCENDCAGGVEDCLHCGSGYCEPQEGAACDDGDACTETDSCQAGTCVGDPVVCMALDECHQAGTCDSVSGVCSDPTEPDGTTCTNGACVNGVCVNLGTGGAGGVGASGASGVGGGNVVAVASFEAAAEDSGCHIARPARSSKTWWMAALLLLAIRRRRLQTNTHLGRTHVGFAQRASHAHVDFVRAELADEDDGAGGDDGAGEAQSPFQRA